MSLDRRIHGTKPCWCLEAASVRECRLSYGYSDVFIDGDGYGDGYSVGGSGPVSLTGDAGDGYGAGVAWGNSEPLRGIHL